MIVFHAHPQDNGPCALIHGNARRFCARRKGAIGGALGPEDPTSQPDQTEDFRDAEGCLQRQAARFRVYGYDADGNLARELLPGGDTEIEWTVQVANTKAAWYYFELAMDISQAVPAPRRNPSITGSGRKRREIRPSPVSIGSRSSGGPHTAFDDGTFMGKPVYLGELRTDADGRLVFLGGRGASASYDGRPVYRRMARRRVRRARERDRKARRRRAARRSGLGAVRAAHGLTFALASGRDAADSIAGFLEGNATDASVHYAATIERAHQGYAAARRRIYAAEGRWPDTPYWSSRI